MGWVGSGRRIQFFDGLGWVGSLALWVESGWVKKFGPMSNSALGYPEFRKSTPRFRASPSLYSPFPFFSFTVYPISFPPFPRHPVGLRHWTRVPGMLTFAIFLKFNTWSDGFCCILSVSVKWLAVKTASEMTYRAFCRWGVKLYSLTHSLTLLHFDIKSVALKISTLVNNFCPRRKWPWYGAPRKCATQWSNWGGTHGNGVPLQLFEGERLAPSSDNREPQ